MNGTHKKAIDQRSGKKKAIDTEKDPYLAGMKFEDLSACTGCLIVYHNKRWYLPDDLPEDVKGVCFTEVTCPACRKIEDGYAEGFVTISGGFKDEHLDEIINLIKNKEEIAMSHNPLDRIMEITPGKDEVRVSTTSGKLAQRIGRILKKTYGGEVEYQLGDDTRITRVYWRRDS